MVVYKPHKSANESNELKSNHWFSVGFIALASLLHHEQLCYSVFVAMRDKATSSKCVSTCVNGHSCRDQLALKLWVCHIYQCSSFQCCNYKHTYEVCVWDDVISICLCVFPHDWCSSLSPCEWVCICTFSCLVYRFVCLYVLYCKCVVVMNVEVVCPCAFVRANQ